MFFNQNHKKKGAITPFLIFKLVTDSKVSSKDWQSLLP